MAMMLIGGKLINRVRGVVRAAAKILGIGNVSSSTSCLLFAANPTSLDIFLLVIGTAAAIGAGILQPVQGYLSGHLVDDLNPACSGASTSTVAGASAQETQYAIAIAVTTFALVYVYLACWGLFGERLVYRLQSAYLRALLHQETAYLDRLQPGEITLRLNDGISSLRCGVDEYCGMRVALFANVLSAYGLCLYQAPSLTLTMSALLPLYLLCMRTVPEYIERNTEIVDERISAATTIAAECLHNMPIVHVFQASRKLEHLYKSRLEGANSAMNNKIRAAAVQSAVLYLIVYASQGWSIWQGSKEMVASKHLSFGKIKTVITFLIAVGILLTKVTPCLKDIAEAQIAYRKLKDILTRQPKIDATSTAAGVSVSALQATADIKVAGVSFNYPSRPDVAVLNDVSFVLPSGGTTAIVGSSGSGKSTLASLLCRLYDPNEGSIEVAGRDIRDIQARSLREKIALVDQDPSLFDCSVLENVAYGIPEVCNSPSLRKELRDMVAKISQGQAWPQACPQAVALRTIIRRCEEALIRAEAYEFVMKLDSGVATHIAGGSYLSIGQKQRIALARAFVRDASILILDESTSALDQETQQIIFSTIRRCFADRTVVLITHQLSFVKDVDKIVVLERGSVLEAGTYAELLDRKGAFANMLETQPAREAAHMGYCSTTSHLDATNADENADSSITNTQEPKKDPVTLHRQQTSTSIPLFFRLITYVFAHASEQLPLMVVGIIGTITIAISDVVEAIIFANATMDINDYCAADEQVLRSAWRYGIIFVKTGLMFLAADFLSTYSIEWASHLVVQRSRVLSLRSLLHQTMAWHAASKARFSLGALDQDTTSVGVATGAGFAKLLMITVTFSAGPFLAFIIAWRIALILLATLPLLIISNAVQTRLLTRFWAKYHGARKTTSEIAKMSLDAHRTVAAFGLESEMVATFRAALSRPYKAALAKVLYANITLAFAFTLPVALFGIVNWWGLRQVVQGKCTLIQYFTVLPLLTSGIESCGQLSSLMNELIEAAVGATKVIELVGMSEDHKDELLTHPLENRKRKMDDVRAPSVQLNEVEFSYQNRPDCIVLHDLSINIPGGSLCAVVGPSGSGKSTIVNLLAELYTPSAGNIKIAGQHISRAKPVHRSITSLVPQDSMLFDDTVQFNLSLGAQPDVNTVDHDKLVLAATDADIHRTIETLPHGYKSACGPGGRHLSGGQKQRLSIARALVREPRLLLMDEPASALDSLSERRLRATIEKLRVHATVVVVTHRLSLVTNADVIFVIEGGRCTASGTHEQLLDRSEWYRQNVLQQKNE